MTTMLEALDEDKIAVLDGFITPSECDAVMKELKYTHWADSTIVKYIGDEHSPAYYSDARKSQTSGQIWFGDELNVLLANIEERLVSLLATSRDRLEEWQATQYGKDDHFDYHVDGGNWEGTAAGERRRSIILYLDTPMDGGGTRFRALNKTVAAKAGRLLVWNNLLPTGKCDFAMIHAGLPVIEGTKTILVSWERERQLRP
ncbi:MAG: 2OG-Fe(II) oxygenase [Sphingomonas bacterium]|nr:2OG-Fe(II) oxygenase [Sphingomonas bacterium]